MKPNLEIVAFDLDDTLTLSRAPLDEEMAELLCRLLAIKKVAVISGASFEQFKKQFIGRLTCVDLNLKNLLILPTSGASLYGYDGEWKQIYSHNLSEAERQKIFSAFDQVFKDTNFEMPEKIYGALVEDRGSQVTFSGLGSEAPLTLKTSWDPTHERRKKLAEALKKYLPDFAVSIGGATSIDVTKRGIDKAYGLQQLLGYAHLKPENLLYVG
ncbi:MAG: HAD-IIB family hydrolase, partial [Candidatus Paceibacterota bacterium]